MSQVNLQKKIEQVKDVQEKYRREATLFAFWKSIPALIKNAKYVNRIKGLTADEETLEMIEGLMQCDTLKDFAEFVDISPHVVYRWNNSEAIQKKVDEFNLHNNAMRFKQDVDYAFTKATIDNADPSRFKLWKQYFEGWVPKEGNVHEIEESTEVIQAKLRELADKKNEDAEEGEILIDDEDEEISKEDNRLVGANEGGPGKSQGDS